MTAGNQEMLLNEWRKDATESERSGMGQNFRNNSTNVRTPAQTAFRLLVLCLICAGLLLGGRSVHAQSYQGSLTGTVVDASGAVIVGAKVTLTDTAKGYKYNAESDKSGRYVIRALDAGDYTLEVTAPTFEPEVVTHITISINENSSIPVKLLSGKVNQVVEIDSSGPALQTEDASLGATFNSRQITELALVGRSIMELTYLAPGVTQAQGNTLNPTGDSGGNSVNFVSNGQRNATAGVYVDGVVVTVGDPNPGIVRPLYIPSVDATAEFRVQQGIFRADTGFSGGTVINIVTKSGTNKIHGTVYDFEQNSYLNANTFFNDLNGIAKPATNNQVYGGVIGGPIRRDKTFFFLVFNGGRSRSSTAYTTGVPSVAEHTGNFSEICTAGFTAQGMCQNQSQQLWDPYTYTYNSSIGLPVAKTFIPYNNLATYTSPGPPAGSNSPIVLGTGTGNLIDPTAARIFQGFPLPNVSTANPTYSRFQNFYNVSTAHNASQEIDGRIDNRFTSKDNLSVKFAYGWGNQQTARCFNNVFDPCSSGPSTAHNYQGTLIYTRTLTGKALFSFSGGIIGNRGISLGNEGYFPSFDPVADLGLPGYILSSGFANTPHVGYAGYTNGNIGAKTFEIYNIGFLGAQADAYVDLLVGKHELKIGADYRLQQINAYSPGVPTGSFSFTAAGTSQYGVSGGGYTPSSFVTPPTTPPTPVCAGNSTVSTTASAYCIGSGDSLASLLVGGPLNGQYLQSTVINAQNPDYDAYVQDTWRVLPKLTIDTGLRYEIQVPETESSNRIAWFDPNAASPISGYKGQIEFASATGQGPRTPFNTVYTNIAPRVGLAYRVGTKTAIRGGYGYFFLPSIGAASGSTSGHSEPWNQYTNTTPYVIGGSFNGATPNARLNNPFPQGGVLAPIGNTPTPLAFIGVAAAGAIRTANATPYQQTYTLGIQRELPGQTLLNVYYLGTKGTHLYFSGAGTLDKLPASVEGMTPTQIAQLANSVTNPFYNAVTAPQGCAGYNLVCQTVLPAYRLMTPYPQFNGVSTVDVPYANSHYHSLQIQLARRFSHGFQAQGSYTRSKSIDDSSITSGGAAYLSGGNLPVQDPNNLRAQRSLSGYDVPNNFVGSYIVELPYGRGHRYGAHLAEPLNILLGGWRTTGFFVLQSGFPIALQQSSGQPIYTYGPLRPTLTGTLHKSGTFNGLNNYFANSSVVSITPNFTLGNAPRFEGSVRSAPIRTATMGIAKSIRLQRLREGASFELRLEAFNVFNHPQFGTPSTDIASPTTFGVVSYQANAPRQVQVAGKIYF